MTPVVLVIFAILFILFVTFESSHWRCLNKLILVICWQKDRSLKLRSNFYPNTNHLELSFNLFFLTNARYLLASFYFLYRDLK